MLVSRNWLQTYFDKELPSGEDLAEKLLFHSFEIEGAEEKGLDFLIDADVLANRAHDCLSHWGIAKEISTILDLTIKGNEERYTKPKDFPQSDKNLEIKIENTENCRRYIGRIIENVEVRKSPTWLRERLETIGQKSINNIVDATNYVLFDLGQPTHIFDLDKLASAKIIIRNSVGEKFTTLSGEEKELDKSMLVIADEEGSIAIAGIKGGKKAEVDSNTKNIVIEVANFHPTAVRKARQKLAMMTDASKRFENELSPELAPIAMEYLTRLILDIASGAETRVGEIVDSYPNGAKDKKIVEFTLAQTNSLLGTNISVKDTRDILRRFEFDFMENGETFSVEIPFMRLDLQIAEDLIEEIGRIYGYNNISGKTVADLDYSPEINKLFLYQNKLRNLLIEHGFSEVETYTFSETGEIAVANPIAKDKPFLRDSMLQGMKNSLELNSKNAGLFGTEIIRIFEMGKVFKNGIESNYLSIGIQNLSKQVKKTLGEEITQLENIVKDISENLSVEIAVEVKENIVEIDLDKLIPDLPDEANYGEVLVLETYAENDKFTPFSQYPFALRDISFWVPAQENLESLEKIIAEKAGESLFRMDLFDQFEKDGKISYAFRLVLQAEDRTLSEEEITEIMENITKALLEKGLTVR